MSGTTFLAIALSLALSVDSVPVSNGTVVLPAGASNHGNPHLICVPAKWTHIAIFFLGNYVAHAATVVTRPSDTPLQTLRGVFAALLLPGSGLERAISVILRRSQFGKDDLQRAARAGVLCTVVQCSKSSMSVRSKRYSFLEQKIHGYYEIPAGFEITVLPPDAMVNPVKSFPGTEHSSPNSRIHGSGISSDYSIVRPLVAIGQTLFAISTLYNTRGDQIERFGYAAFGLTVTPYAFMSVMNLLASLSQAQYSSMFLVESPDMRKLIERGEARFDGVVGVLGHNPVKETNGGIYSALRAVAVRYLAMILAAGIPLAIIGGLTHFHAGSSTHAQRVWIMVWLGFGASTGAIQSLQKVESNAWGFVLFYSAPSIGGFVVVGQMIANYGVCTKF